MINVVVWVEAGDIDFALKQLRNKSEKVGLISDFKRLQNFIPKSARRKEKSAKAQARRRGSKHA